MTGRHRVRAQRLLREAEGYLELGLPQLALSTLARLTDPGTFRGHQLWLEGESLRSLERYAEGAEALEQAADLLPSNVDIYLALGWCYKRCEQLAQAIESLCRARDVDPARAIVHYNLACYYSLDGQKRQALDALATAIGIDEEYRERTADESDFDPLRHDADFQSLTGLSFRE